MLYQEVKPLPSQIGMPSKTGVDLQVTDTFPTNVNPSLQSNLYCSSKSIVGALGNTLPFVNIGLLHFGRGKKSTENISSITVLDLNYDLTGDAQQCQIATKFESIHYLMFLDYIYLHLPPSLLSCRGVPHYCRTLPPHYQLGSTDRQGRWRLRPCEQTHS